jgi:lysyl-tRNA synthetase class I
MKVKVTGGQLTKKELAQLKSHSIRKIKEYVQSNAAKNKAFKFYSVQTLIDKKLTTKKFLEFNHVCMNCGDVQEMSSYPIAQIAQGHKVNYTCACGHITILPQIL